MRTLQFPLYFFRFFFCSSTLEMIAKEKSRKQKRPLTYCVIIHCLWHTQTHHIWLFIDWMCSHFAFHFSAFTLHWSYTSQHLYWISITFFCEIHRSNNSSFRFYEYRFFFLMRNIWTNLKHFIESSFIIWSIFIGQPIRNTDIH